jgi:transcriptional regulator GlxA family with amidase domain
MKRRDILAATGAGIIATALPLPGATSFGLAANADDTPPNLGKPVKPPAHGPLQVAFVVGPNTVLIDVAGPWEAFTDAMLPVHTYTVAPSMDDVDLGGIKARPDYTFQNAPQPHVLIVPATKALPESLAWIQRASAHADITMSICTGAFVLAKAGLLNGLYATTHHGGYDELARLYPKIKVLRGPRFVETRDISTSGGETSGIDLALRVVERYFGPKAAASSAENMEHVRTRRPWA